MRIIISLPWLPSDCLIARLENDVAELRERLDKDFVNLRTLIIDNHAQVMQTLEKSRTEITVAPRLSTDTRKRLYSQQEQESIQTTRPSVLQESSLYAKLKQRYGDAGIAAGQSQGDAKSGDGAKGSKDESDLIKLTCFDFKVTDPLGLEQRTSTEGENAKKPWWKALCLCSLLPDDDAQSQVHYNYHRQSEKHKTKHAGKKTHSLAPRPIAEGLENERTTPPSIMSNLPRSSETRKRRVSR